MGLKLQEMEKLSKYDDFLCYGQRPCCNRREVDHGGGGAVPLPPPPTHSSLPPPCRTIPGKPAPSPPQQDRTFEKEAVTAAAGSTALRPRRQNLRLNTEPRGRWRGAGGPWEGWRGWWGTSSHPCRPLTLATAGGSGESSGGLAGTGAQSSAALRRPTWRPAVT